MEKRQKNIVVTTCFMKSIPIEVIFSILHNLGSKDLAKLECVNSAWQQLLNNNDWWWKNRCFSDDLWLKMCKNTIYFNCMSTILEIQWKEDEHHRHYNDKEWDEMCEQVEKHADSKNFMEKLPDFWNWKELNHLWDVVDRCDELYIFHVHRRSSHPRLNDFSSFMNDLCSSISREIKKFRFAEMLEELGLSPGPSALCWKNKGRYYFLDIRKENQGRFVDDRAAIPFVK